MLIGEIKRAHIPALLIAALGLSACEQTDSKVISENLSKAADMFEINRRIVFYNGITDQYMLTIEGRCSIDTSGTGATLFVTCKTGADAYKKHFLGLSDNVTFFAEQLDEAKASAYRFKPQSILPDIDLRGSGAALLKNE